MADDNGHPPADLTTDGLDQLTRNQLTARRTPAATELQALIDSGDRNSTVSKRVRELASFLETVDDAIRFIDSTAAFQVPAEPVAPDPPAPVASTPAPTPQPQPAPAPAPTPEPQPAPEPAPEPEPEPAPAPAEPEALTDEQLAAEMERLTTELAARGTDIGEGGGAEQPISPDEITDPATRVGGAPIFATAGSHITVDGITPEGPTTLTDVGKRMRNLHRMKHLIPNDGTPLRFNLYRRDTLPGYDGPRLGEDPEANTRLLFHDPIDEAVAAAADLSICGDPTEIQVRGNTLDSTTPFLDSLAGNTVPARECVVRWRQPLSVETISPGPQLWSTLDQAAVDPADRSTWKPITADLPPCEDYCYAEPFDTVFGLGVTLNDQICRPERIEEMNRWIEVFHAIVLEQTALSIYDLNVGASHTFSFEADSLVVANRPTLGAMPAVTYAVHALLSRAGMDRHSPTSGWWVAVHPSLLKTLALDMHMAGENPPANMEAALLDALRPAGVTNVVVLKDFGICEGLLYTGYQANAVLCAVENADIPVYNNEEVGCTAFGAGVSLPTMPSSARLRFFQPDQWFHGSTNLVDYALHTSAEMMRQNRSEYFGERRDLLFKAGNNRGFEAILDIEDLCPNGQRVVPDVWLPCPLPVTGGTGSPPLAPGISPIGEPNPMTLANMEDPVPDTEPRVVARPSEDPRVAPGTAISGTTLVGDSYTVPGTPEPPEPEEP